MQHKQLLLLAAGTGIAPMIQLLRCITSNEDDETIVRLLFGVPKYHEIYLKEELDTLNSFWNVSTLYCLSRVSWHPHFIVTWEQKPLGATSRSHLCISVLPKKSAQDVRTCFGHALSFRWNAAWSWHATTGDQCLLRSETIAQLDSWSMKTGGAHYHCFVHMIMSLAHLGQSSKMKTTANFQATSPPKIAHEMVTRHQTRKQYSSSCLLM